jgi:hypothetical protein
VDQLNHECPREELAGVRVSGQLQVEAGLLGQRRDLRIARQKQTEGRPRVAVGREVRTRPRSTRRKLSQPMQRKLSACTHSCTRRRSRSPNQWTTGRIHTMVNGAASAARTGAVAVNRMAMYA